MRTRAGWFIIKGYVTMLKTLKIKLKISHRLALGFAIVVLMLAAAVGTTLWRIGAINEGTGRIVGLRMPTAQTSAQLTNDINASLAALRGWMLTGNPAFKTERAAVWRSIAIARANMDELSSNWTNPKNVENWSKFKTILD